MKLLSIGTYGLHIIQYPSQRWGYVGSIPEILCKECKGTFGPEMRSMVFDTQQEAINYFEERKHLLS